MTTQNTIMNEEQFHRTLFEMLIKYHDSLPPYFPYGNASQFPPKEDWVNLRFFAHRHMNYKYNNLLVSHIKQYKQPFSLVEFICKYYLMDYVHVSSNLNTEIWYRFIDNKWIVDDRKNISDILRSECLSILNNVFTDVLGTREHFMCIAPYNMKQFLTDHNFLSRTNPRGILAFNNGVYDFEKGAFRMTKPTDYNTMTTGYNYTPTLSTDDRNKLIDNLEHIMLVLGKQNKDTIEKFLTELAGKLSGKREIVKAEFWQFDDLAQGTVPIIVNMIKDLFGDYYTEKPAICFELPNDSLPEFANSNGHRFCLVRYGDNKITFQASTIQHVLDNTKTRTTRLLHCEPYEFALQCGLTFIGKTKPDIDINCENCLNNIKFGTYQMHNPTHVTGIEQNMSPQLMNLLIRQYYPKYLTMIKQEQEQKPKLIIPNYSGKKLETKQEPINKTKLVINDDIALLYDCLKHIKEKHGYPTINDAEKKLREICIEYLLE